MIKKALFHIVTTHTQGDDANVSLLRWRGNRATQRLSWRPALWALSLALAVPFTALGAFAAGEQTVALPTVFAPPAGAEKPPYPNTTLAIDQHGYIQEEYFIQGKAHYYEPVAALERVSDGKWETRASERAEPYTVRLIIRRPNSAENFNGTVLVDWLNVSAGYDSDTFDSFGEWFMDAGYVYVGVTAQAIGANHLRDWDPDRYGAIEHPGDSFSYDIFSQAVRALREADPKPLGNLAEHVKALVAWGGSQSGSRLFTYINAVHPHARVVDGFVPFITGGGAPLSQQPLASIAVPSGAGALIRGDITTPVLYQLSESELGRAARGVHSQPDSEYFRLWEYAGTSHANSVGTEFTMKRLAANGMPTAAFPPCGEPPINDLSVFAVYRATLEAMHRWLQEGHAPAIAPRVAMAIPDDPGEPAAIIRDPATGLAEGGIRLPQIAVPLGTYSGTRPDAVLAEYPTCALFGAVDMWNADTDSWDGDPALDISPDPEPDVRELYASEAEYRQAIQETAQQLVDDGFLLDEDAQEIIRESESITIH